jgi:hypothetical protein
MRVIIGIVILVIIIMLVTNQIEGFDKDMTEFLPLGRVQYGLRGEPVNLHPLEDCYFDKYQCYTNTISPLCRPE